MEKKVWLVTGCSTGFGKELVRVLAEMGHIAIGTVRKQEQVQELESIDSQLVTGVVLDVQKQDSIDRVADLIKEKHGRLDVLVNNAGYGSIGPIEEISDEELQRQFDVNVFGAVRMIKLALPFMRKQKSGHILNITSIAGLVGFPGSGIYNGSKFALEGIGEALSHEVSHLGIKVTNIEPGPFRTDWAGRSATYSSTDISDYSESAYKTIDRLNEGSGKQVGDPIRACKAMIEITELPSPPVHLPLGAMAYKVLENQMEIFSQEIETFKHVGEPTDYSEDELKNMDN